MTSTKIFKNDNFKTVSIGCFFRLPLTKENLSYLTLLSNYQQLGTKNYPNQKELEAYADELYAAKFEIRPQIYGNTIVVRAEGNFIEPELVNDDTYTYETIINFFEEMIFNVNFSKEATKQLNLAKKQVKFDYESFSEVASNKAYQLFFKEYYNQDDDFQDPIFGDLNLINHIQIEELHNFYQKLLQAPQTVIGYAKLPEELKTSLANSQFANLSSLAFAKDSLKIMTDQTPRQLEVDYDYNQAQLIYGYPLKSDYETPIIGLVFSQILGGDEYSLLFQEVRQKAGLVYSVFSDYYFYNNLLLVQTSLMADSVEEASTIINQQIQRLKNDDFDNHLLNTAKQQLISHRLILEEMPQFNIQSELISQLRDIDKIDFKSAVNSVTREQIVEFANQLSDSVRLLVK